jgi:hypothetical protein
MERSENPLEPNAEAPRIPGASCAIPGRYPSRVRVAARPGLGATMTLGTYQPLDWQEQLMRRARLGRHHDPAGLRVQLLER